MMTSPLTTLYPVDQSSGQSRRVDGAGNLTHDHCEIGEQADHVPSRTPGQDSETLAALLEQAHAGDSEAIGALYERYRPGIYRYLCRRGGDPVLAEDLTDSVFVRVLEKLEGEGTWHRSFSGWLYRIAQNLLIDHVRAVRRRPQCELSDSVSSWADEALDDEVERRLRAGEVRGAIDRLRPSYASILRLRFLEDLSQADVGRRLGKSEQAVKVAQHRALKALRRQLVGDGTSPQKDQYRGPSQLLSTVRAS